MSEYEKLPGSQAGFSDNSDDLIYDNEWEEVDNPVEDPNYSPQMDTQQSSDQGSDWASQNFNVSFFPLLKNHCDILFHERIHSLIYNSIKEIIFLL